MNAARDILLGFAAVLAAAAFATAQTERPSDAEIGARVAAIQAQRNEAMDRAAILQGSLAVAQAALEAARRECPKPKD